MTILHFGVFPIRRNYSLGLGLGLGLAFRRNGFRRIGTEPALQSWHQTRSALRQCKLTLIIDNRTSLPKLFSISAHGRST